MRFVWHLFFIYNRGRGGERGRGEVGRSFLVAVFSPTRFEKGKGRKEKKKKENGGVAGTLILRLPKGSGDALERT